MTDYQLMLDFLDGYTLWQVTKKTDVTCRQLADRHYSRQTVGASSFCRPGKNYVLRTLEGNAVWVSWYSKYRDDGFYAIECTLFRNESEHLSSSLIILASLMTFQHFKKDDAPEMILTYVDEKSVQSSNAGYCYLMAGYKKLDHKSSRGLLAFTVTYEDLIKKVRALIFKEEWYKEMSNRMAQIRTNQRCMNEAFSEYEFEMAVEFAGNAYNGYKSLLDSVKSTFSVSFESAAAFVQSMCTAQYDENIGLNDLYMTLIDWNSMENTEDLQAIIEQIETFFMMSSVSSSPLTHAQDLLSYHFMNWLEYDTIENLLENN